MATEEVVQATWNGCVKASAACQAPALFLGTRPRAYVWAFQAKAGALAWSSAKDTLRIRRHEVYTCNLLVNRMWGDILEGADIDRTSDRVDSNAVPSTRSRTCYGDGRRARDIPTEERDHLNGSVRL